MASSTVFVLTETLLIFLPLLVIAVPRHSSLQQRPVVTPTPPSFFTLTIPSPSPSYDHNSTLHSEIQLYLPSLQTFNVLPGPFSQDIYLNLECGKQNSIKLKISKYIHIYTLIKKQSSRTVQHTEMSHLSTCSASASTTNSAVTNI